MRLKDKEWIENLPLIQKIKDEYKYWKNGDYILILAGTGTGKNTFIINILEDVAKKNNKKILLLSNRIDLKNQNKNNIANNNANGIISAVNYQHIENCIFADETDTLSKQKLNFYSSYDYIVCDETHYFLADSWNKTTDASYEWILKQQAVKIFMSATGGNFFKLLLEDIKIPTEQIKGYKIDTNYEYIEKLIYYKNQEYIEQLIKNLPPDEKVIYFCRKVKNNITSWFTDSSILNRELGENLAFVCGNQHSFKKYMTDDALNEDNSLKYQFTIATKVWDNGINILDSNLKHVIIDFDMPDDFIQCLGRRRLINKDDKIILHVRNWSKTDLNRHCFYIKNEIKKTDEFIDNPKEALKKYRSNKSATTNCMHIDVETEKLMVNKLLYKNNKIMVNDYISAMEIGFDNYINKLLNCDTIKIEYNDDKIIKDKTSKIESYLNDLTGRKLFRKDQQELCAMIIKEMYKIKSKYRIRGKLLKPSTLEIIIRDELKLEYGISKPIKESSGECRGKNYIIISKLTVLSDVSNDNSK